MQIQLTLQEKLKDLRVNQRLTLMELSEKVGISASALGAYENENNEGKDVSVYCLTQLAKFYGVSTDYLLGLTENLNERRTPLEELRLSDGAVEILRTGKCNPRLLSEMICHPCFRKLMIDAEIYADSLVQAAFENINGTMEAARDIALSNAGADPDDLYMSTLKAARITDEDYYSQVVSKDLMTILKDIRKEHSSGKAPSGMDAYENFVGAYEELTKEHGSTEELKCSMLLKQLGINRTRLTDAEFVTMINVFQKSDLLKSPRSPKRMKHGKG
ncbi:MAG: helix-turn-helix transcriptional regulator [Lachnospiraceae bacterium]|nr:helix-turn-helix transcriptional regulator [Lachnospiraceae bacterium]